LPGSSSFSRPITPTVPSANRTRPPISRIEEYTSGLTRERFLADRMRIDAVVRNLKIICEAAQRITEETRNRTSDVEWRHI
jgi:uncharacterized protein with HEPN domain